MTDEEKKLLLIDLCSRMPYGVKIYNTSFFEPQIQTLFGRIDDDVFIMKETYKSVGVSVDDFGASYEKRCIGYLEFIKPYLRPISSLTAEECDRLFKILDINEKDGDWLKINDINIIRLFTENGKDFYEIAEAMDYLYSIHVDFKDMIEKGLAIKAPEGMYENN